MLVKEVMTQNFEVIEGDQSLRAAAEKMRDMDIGCLPVVEDDHAVGIVTDRDITIRAVAQGMDPNTIPVREVMTSTMWCLSEDEDISEAARLMGERQIRRVLVLDESQQITGILSLGDVALYLEDSSLTGEILEQVSEPAGTGLPGDSIVESDATAAGAATSTTMSGEEIEPRH